MNRCDCPSEIDLERVRSALTGAPPRNRLLIELGFECGLRISELLGLTVGSVVADGDVRPILRVTRACLKGGRGQRARSVTGRVIPLNARARQAIAECISAVQKMRSELPLFPSREGEDKPITRRQATRVIRKIFLSAGLDPARVWAGHSLRRSFVRRVFDATKDIQITRAAVGHKCISTTQAYLGLAEEEAQAAILQIGALPPALTRREQKAEPHLYRMAANT